MYSCAFDWFCEKPLSKTKSDIYKFGSILDNSVFVSMVNSRSLKLNVNLYHMASGYTLYISCKLLLKVNRIVSKYIIFIV